IALILPLQRKKNIIKLAEVNQLYCIRQTTVWPAEHILPKRVLIELSNVFPSFCEITKLILANKEQQRTQDYRDLTQEFYL
ncbi:MAG: tRNA (adenine-N6)-methyltransferase, partial [Tannerella sp.]|nr:tRNA (adenine-N6)-methyltransferase [Tannerella sp.]